MPLYTPRPWIVRPNREAEGVVSEHNGAPFTIGTEDGLHVASVRPQGPNTEANAFLLSLAPDLLVAAETLVASLHWEEVRSGTTYNGYEELRSAVSKAKRHTFSDRS